MKNINKYVKKIIYEIYSKADFLNFDNQILQIKISEPDSEIKTDNIWTSLDIKMRENGSDMTKVNSNDLKNLLKLKSLVDHFSSKGKNITLWLKRKQICNNWKQ
ncbi:hypothetical protein EBU91_03325 [bacterium]|nr:hypothetical protein [bacterium]